MTPLRTEWRPTNRAEFCAAISVAALRGEITPEDESFIAGWITFRSDLLSSPTVTQPEDDDAEGKR